MGIKVNIHNDTRTVEEIFSMWDWMIDTFESPGKDARWKYGKDSEGVYGSDYISGPWDIEWFEFQDEQDATWFSLKWASLK